MITLYIAEGIIIVIFYNDAVFSYLDFPLLLKKQLQEKKKKY